MPAGNTPTSSNLEARTFVCFNPKNPSQPCPICDGRGVISLDVPTTDPRWGKLERCPNYPAKVDENRQERLRKISNLRVFASKTLENFDTKRKELTLHEKTSLETALHLAVIYADAPDGWMLFQGGYGCGKTHLAAAIGNERLKHGDSVLFITTPDLLDHLRSTYSPNSEIGYDEFFDRVKNSTMLILDDLGAENHSAWAQEKLFQLFNHRYVHEKYTVITTNNDLSRLDPRLKSRLDDVDLVQVVHIIAPDYRSIKPKLDVQLLSRLHLYRNMTFDSFDVQHRLLAEERANLSQAAQITYEFAQNPAGWLMLMGTYGSGKTHLAAAIANHYMLSHRDGVMFITTPDLLDYLRTTFSPDTARTFDDLFTEIRNVPLLVLDDLGSEMSKPWAQEKLFQLLDYRYVTQLPTVITTSQEIEQIERLSPRLVTRLLDSRLCRNVAIKAPSYVLRLKRQR